MNDATKPEMPQEHTPGPWLVIRIDREFGTIDVDVHHKEGNARKQAEYAFGHGDTDAHVVPLPTALAAPDLLAACEATLAELHPCYPECDCPICSTVRAAIRKARGES